MESPHLDLAFLWNQGFWREAQALPCWRRQACSIQASLIYASLIHALKPCCCACGWNPMQQVPVSTWQRRSLKTNSIFQQDPSTRGSSDQESLRGFALKKKDTLLWPRKVCMQVLLHTWKLKKKTRHPWKKEFLGTGKGEECSVHTQKFHNKFHWFTQLMLVITSLKTKY